MRLPVVAVSACVLGLALLAGPASAGGCPPQVAHRHAAVRVVHHYRVVRELARCPIALAHEIRQGCNAYHQTTLP